jgi:hypothetical protein
MATLVTRILLQVERDEDMFSFSEKALDMSAVHMVNVY